MIQMKYISFLLILLIISISFQVVFADENITDASEIKSFDEINQITSESENSTIIIEGTYQNTGNEITLGKSITLDGQGKTILNGNHGRIMVISGSNITLKNMKFINAFSEFDGSAILSYRANLSIINCTFINNSAFNGGAIKFYGDNATITDSTFINNQCESDGGSVLCEGSNLKITNTYFESNKAYNEYGSGVGGAICINGDNGLIENSIFIKNYARNGGATEYNTPSAKGDKKIKNCTFISNSADFGGALYINSQNIIVSNCIFENNKGTYDYSAPAYQIRACILHGFNVSIDDNFWGTNIETGDAVFSNGMPVNSWINMDLKYLGDNQYKLYFISSNGSEISVMPYYTVKIIYKETNNNVADVLIKNGSGYFNQTNNITLDNINIYSMQNGLINKVKTKVSLTPASTSYNSNQQFSIKLVDINNNGISGVKFTVKIFIEEDTYKAYYATTNSKGIATFKPTLSSLKTYKVELTAPSNTHTILKTIKTIKITKAKTTIKAPKITANYKKSKIFQITVKHSVSKKAIANLILKLKIGKKTYTITTNKNGIGKFNTKNLKKGKYTVLISSTNKYYTISGKSTIIIK